ncbi:MAG TPA: GtrA family protein [Niabella sp.]|nr:GtrA family protein [Niabella sp.]HRB63563.1 GtrA family protein [Niabella sp.]HRB73849.1 GtrA family protein [Niabella sp.]HRB93507.1 GtrA family protein [Niabella sp.]
MPLQTFRYLAVGGCNTLLGLVVYYVAYHYIFAGQFFHVWFYTFESYTAALAVSFTVALFWGFFMMKFVVFDDSKIRGHVQFLRYLMVSLLNLTLNWLLLKVAVEFLHFYPTFAQLGTTVVLIFFSYLVQRHFTFKKEVIPDYVEPDEKGEV